MSDFRPSRFQVLPLIVKNLLIINTIIVFAQYVLGKFGYDMSTDFGLHYWRSPLFKPWQLLTHMFLHGSYNDLNATVLHLFSNMFALWMFGSVLENVWGPKRFLTFYLVCGIGAALCHLAVLGVQFHFFEHDFDIYQQNATLDNFLLFIQKHKAINNVLDFTNLIHGWSASPTSIDYAQASVRQIHAYQTMSYNEATVGASGAVMGVLFAFGYLFPNTLLYFYFLVPIKAKYFVAGYALFELFAGVRNSAGDNIAHFAHLGGMLFAFILLRIWNRTNRKHFY